MTKWRSLWNICLIALIFRLLSGCGHMPVVSMVKLARVDFQTTDPDKLRVAVKVPNALRVRAEGTVLRVAVKMENGEEEARDFALRQMTDEVERDALAREGDGGSRISIYAIAPSDVPLLRLLRAGLMQKKKDRTKGSLTISVRPDSCRAGPLPDGPVPFSTYLKTAETGGYVPLVRDVDLRQVDPQRDIAEMIPACR